MALLWLLLAVSSCSPGNRPAGLADFEWHRRTNGYKPANGDIMVMAIAYYAPNDSLLFSTAQAGPLPMYYTDTALNNPGGIEEAIALIREGDSATFTVQAGNLFGRTFGTPLPEGLTAESRVRFHMALVGVYDEAGFEKWQRLEQLRQLQAATQQDVNQIVAHLEATQATAQPTGTGLHYRIEQPGTGPNAQYGDSVYVYYTAKTLDGVVFDSNIEEISGSFTTKPARPVSAPVGLLLGEGRFSVGLDYGLQYMNQGSTAVLYLPAMMAFSQLEATGFTAASQPMVVTVQAVRVVPYATFTDAP